MLCTHHGGPDSADPDGTQPKNLSAVTLISAKLHYIYTPEEHVHILMQNSAAIKWRFHECFDHDVRDGNSIGELGTIVCTASQPHSLVTSERNPDSEVSPQVIGFVMDTWLI